MGKQMRNAMNERAPRELIRAMRCPVHKASLKPCRLCAIAFTRAEGQRERQHVAERKLVHEAWLKGGQHGR